MLDFHFNTRLREFASRLTVDPVDRTHKGSVLGEFEFTRQAHFDEESAILRSLWQDTLRNVELQSISFPPKALGLVGNQDAGLANDRHIPQVA